MFVGGNDVCDHCYNSVSTGAKIISHKSNETLRLIRSLNLFCILSQLLFSAENYIRNIRESLDYLHKEVKSIEWEERVRGSYTALISMHSCGAPMFSSHSPSQTRCCINWTFLYQVPRALVNLVEPLYINPLRELHMNPSLKCPTWLIRWVFLH